MSDQPQALRVAIIDSLDAALQAVFGPDGAGTFRAFRIGPWKPGQTAPACTLTDLGSGRRENWDGVDDAQDPGALKILRVGITLDLEANWDRNNGAKDWARIVESIGVVVARWAAEAAALGVNDAEVVNDEPLEAIIESGSSTHIWALEAEITYAATWPQEDE